MKVLGIVILVLVAVALAATGGYWYARHTASQTSATSESSADPDDAKNFECRE